MTRDQILAKIAELEAKHSACTNAEAKHYYALCLAGWRLMLEKV
jgi:hypothetical protein